MYFVPVNAEGSRPADVSPSPSAGWARRGKAWWKIPAVLFLAVVALAIDCVAQAAQPKEAAFDIFDFQIEGAHRLTQAEMEGAVYPYLGPARTAADVEKARAALEKVFQEKGFQTVTVEVPAQKVKDGVVVLRVVEATVGHLRVNGSRFYPPDEIKKQAPSLAEGTVPNFKSVTAEIIALNQSPDLRVTPTLKAGIDPNTVDVDLNVKDTAPMHGSLELNNRYSEGTSALRLNGSASFNNLWQQDHTLGVSFQIAPQDVSQVEVFSAYYLAHIPGVDGISFMLQGTEQNSNVSTLGGAAVAGKGQTVGPRVIFTLPTLRDYYESVTLGIDYKHYEQNVNLGTGEVAAPITYFPLSAAYNGTWIGKGYTTVLNGAVNLHLRGLGSNPDEFDDRRYGADSSFIYFRGDLSHTRDLPGDFQVFGKVQGQIADVPLIDSEEFSGGGLDTARGYLESEALGDNALFGSLELRGPSLAKWLGPAVDEWRFYAFTDAGWLTLNDPLPEQTSSFTLASVGVGTRIKLLNHGNGSLDVGVPLIAGPQTSADSVLFTFRVWADF